MKKKTIILLCGLLLTGCGKIKTNDITIEAGNEMSTNISDYIDMSDLDEKDVSLDIENVDQNVVGDYEASILHKNKTYPFTVHVVDTTVPKAEKTDDYIICQPGELVASDYIKNIEDVSETKVGFLSFERKEDLKLMTNDELKEAAKEKDNSEETSIFNDEMSFEEKKDIEEEGIYDVKIAVKDVSGNIRIFGYDFYIDGTGPDLPEHEDETIQINDVNGAFVPDLDEYYCTDNFDPAELVVEETTVDYESQDYYLKDGKTVEEVKIIIDSKDRAGNKSTRSWIITAVNSYDYTKDVMEALGITNQVVAENTTTASDGFDRGKAEEAFALVNQKRAENGVGALTWNESLYNLACERAQELVQSFSHTRLDGTSVNNSVFALGYTGSGENAARYGTTASNVVDSWMNSDGHRGNMLNGSWIYSALACYRCNGRYYWINLFAK